MKQGTLYFQWAPSEWPPRQRVPLHAQREADIEIRLSCEAGEFFLAQIEEHGVVREFRSQKVSMPVGEFAVTVLRWDGGSIDIFIGGEQLGPYDEGGAPLEIKPLLVSVPHGRTATIGADVLANASADELLFLMTLHDLTERLSKGTVYDTIRASGLIRQLLFDAAAPLVHTINRNLRLPLEFVVAKAHALPADIPAPATHWRSLFPSGSESTDTCKLDAFLALTVITHEGVAYSVLDVVAAVAHVLGGIHLGQAKDEDTKALVVLGDRVLIHDQSIIWRALQDITRVCLDALMPFAEAIAEARRMKQGVRG